MEVSYLSDLEDGVEFNLYVVENTATGRRQKTNLLTSGTLLILLISYTVWSIARTSTDSWIQVVGKAVVWVGPLGAFGFFLFFYFGYRELMLASVRKLLKDIKGVGPGPTKIWFDVTGIHCHSPLSETYVPWSSISQVGYGKTADYFFFGYGATIIVPHRAFATVDERTAFMKAAEDFKGHAN